MNKTQYCDSCSFSEFSFNPDIQLLCTRGLPVEFIMPKDNLDLKTRSWGWQMTTAKRCPSHSMRASRRHNRRTPRSGGSASRHAGGLSGAPDRSPTRAKPRRNHYGISRAEGDRSSSGTPIRTPSPAQGRERSVPVTDLVTHQPGRLATFADSLHRRIDNQIRRKVDPGTRSES